MDFRIVNYSKTYSIKLSLKHKKPHNTLPPFRKPTINLPTTPNSLIIDITNLTPDSQKELIDSCCQDIWLNRQLYGEYWFLIVLEELELYARSLRGQASQNLKRIAHAGRNKQVRILGITTDLALLDPSFIRLCQQRYHARLGIEENSKRKFKAYYGKEWTKKATTLETGDFIYLLRDQLSLISAPLFMSKRQPQSICRHKSWFRRFIDFTVEAWNEA